MTTTSLRKAQVRRRCQIALETGEWWVVPWWRDSCYYRDGRCSRAEADAAFDALMRVFDVGWMTDQRSQAIGEARQWLASNRDAVGRDNFLGSIAERLGAMRDDAEAYSLCGLLGFRVEHAMFNMLLSEGRYPFTLLVAFGDDLVRVERASLVGDLVQRLRNAREYAGARFELMMLAHFLRQKFRVEREPVLPSRRKPDLRVGSGPDMLYIELKRLALAKGNVDLTVVSAWIMHRVISDSRVGNASVSLGLRLLPELADRGSDWRKDVDDVFGRLEPVALAIADHVSEGIRAADWGRHVVPNLAEYEIRPRQDGLQGVQGSFEGLPLSSEKEARKVCRNAVSKAARQLPTDQPGVVLVHAPFSLDAVLARSVIERCRTDLRHVSAVIFVTSSYQDGAVGYRPLLIRNPLAFLDVTGHAAVRTVMSLGDAGERNHVAGRN